MKESSFFKGVTFVSILIPLAVAVIFWMPKAGSSDDARLLRLPLLHACLNGTTFLVLLLGYFLILKKKISQHRASMIAAAALSTIFLISYVTYHSLAPAAKFGGTGIIRYFYFAILITHIILAAGIVPLVLITLYRGLTGKIATHRKIARWTLPLWLYVAFTGVVVYIMMSPYYPSITP